MRFQFDSCSLSKTYGSSCSLTRALTLLSPSLVKYTHILNRFVVGKTPFCCFRKSGCHSCNTHVATSIQANALPKYFFKTNVTSLPRKSALCRQPGDLPTAQITTFSANTIIFVNYRRFQEDPEYRINIYFGRNIAYHSNILDVEPVVRQMMV